AVVTLLSVPVWYALIRRIQKHRAWALGLVISTIALLGMFFVPAGEDGFVPLIALICLRADGGRELGDCGAGRLRPEDHQHPGGTGRVQARGSAGPGNHPAGRCGHGRGISPGPPQACGGAAKHREAYTTCPLVLTKTRSLCALSPPDSAWRPTRSARCTSGWKRSSGPFSIGPVNIRGRSPRFPRRCT